MDPEKALQLGDGSQTLGAARNAAQAAIDELAPVAKWEPRELVQQFGAQSGWKLPGVLLHGFGERLAAERAEAA